MARYHRNEARQWAREHMNGVANVIIPTMTSDFKRLNLKAARHDIETAIGHGFVGRIVCQVDEFIGIVSQVIELDRWAG